VGELGEGNPVVPFKDQEPERSQNQDEGRIKKDEKIPENPKGSQDRPG
jgi:hypothetical protein